MNTILISAIIAFTLTFLILLLLIANVQKRGNTVLWTAVLFHLIFWTLAGAGIGWAVS